VASFDERGSDVPRKLNFVFNNEDAHGAKGKGRDPVLIYSEVRQRQLRTR
jgi:hypothetical protein